MKNRRIRAFTLIELVVVVLILGILAALIVPRVVGHAAEAKTAKATADIAELQNELQQFHVNCDRYPTTEEGLDALVHAPANASGWKGPYSQNDIPLDPWGDPYVYVSPGANGDDSYALSTNGPDHQPNTADDIGVQSN